MEGAFDKTRFAAITMYVFAAAAPLALASLSDTDGNRTSLAANPVPADHQSLKRGRELYRKHCAMCHGASGRGDGSAARDLDPAPPDLSKPDVLQQTDSQLFRKITRGKRPMPSFARKLQEEDRWHLVNFIRTLGPSTANGGDR